MPRRPRVVLPHIPLHLIQRGNNRQVCFVADEDYRFYLDWLKEFAGKTGCRVHAYVLMTNHVHLLVSADRGESPGALMKALGQRYVQYFNRTYRRSGTLWEGRYRSCLTQAEDYLLNKKDTHFNCLNKQHSLNSCPWPAPVAPPSRWPTHLSETCRQFETKRTPTLIA